ncbi:MAG TPA: YfhO family protein [Verrucomicrobiae bacterium]|nr:YfhO family protein [Verrucomicrobiae bacterium]
MRIETSPNRPKSKCFYFLLTLAGILAGVFWKSFLPDFILFNNDGPLGAVHAAWMKLPQEFFGCWYDLCTIGVNTGAAIPDPTNFTRWVLSPVGFAKFIIPVSLWFFGAAAFFFFRRSGFSNMAAILGSLAATLTTDFFSNACWGSVPPIIAFGMDFLALGALIKRDKLPFWIPLALAGLAVGMNVIEAADIGAIFSLLVAAFVFYQSLVEDGSSVFMRAARGIGRTVVIAVFAGFIAAYAVSALVGSSVKGISGTQQDEQTKAAHWDFATQWSLPKRETLGLVVPGLFGFRMDTPGGGNYWGAMGRDPAWDRYFEQGEKGPAPQGFFRYTGRGFYIGITVVVIAFWAGLQSFRRKDSVFTLPERKLLWFWVAASIVALLLAYGRFAPFYRLLYSLPYFSTIRNPEKFLHVVTFSAIILFGYGIQGLKRRYLDVPLANPGKGLANWWAKAATFDRRWVVGSVLAIVLTLVGWVIYAASRHALESYLKTVEFNETTAAQIAGYSIRQVGWFALLLIAISGLLLLIFSGAFAGRRAKWAGVLMGVLLIVDLLPADAHYIVFWNYKEKYEVGNLEPIIKFLADKPYERRVAYLLPQPLSTPEAFAPFHELYGLEWTQQLFPYNNIQTLDIVQMPRMPEDLVAFNSALQVGVKEDGQGHIMLDDKTMYRIGRQWQLTATRYLLGPAPLLGAINQQFYTTSNRFRIVQRFELGPRPGVAQPTQYSQIEAVPTDDPNAHYALFEFMDALPRATLFSNWQVSTNDLATLGQLASPTFDPAKTVLLSQPLPVAVKPAVTNEDASAVKFVSYDPEHIKLEATPSHPSILMLADRYDPDWQVWVDGKKAELLKCDYLMRGVYLEPGRHEVEFKFVYNLKMLYVNLAAIVFGFCLLGYAVAMNRKSSSK